MWPNQQETVDLVTFTGESLNGKLHFLCSAEVKVDHQELASMEYNTNTPIDSQNNEPDKERSNAESRCTIPKRKVT